MRLFWYDFCNSVIEAIFRTFFNYNLIIAFNVTSLMFARNILQRSIKKPFSSAKKLLGHPRKKAIIFFFSLQECHTVVFIYFHVRVAKIVKTCGVRSKRLSSFAIHLSGVFMKMMNFSWKLNWPWQMNRLLSFLEETSGFVSCLDN